MKNVFLPIIFLAAILITASGDSQKTTVKPTPKGLESPVIPGEICIKLKQGVSPLSSPDEPVLFGVKSLDEKAARFEVNQMVKRFRMRPVPEKPGVPDLSRIYRIKFPEIFNPVEVAKAFADDPNVEYATPNYIRQYDAMPNDPMYNLQFYLPQIMAEEAWDIHKGQDGDEEVVVAIIDCGVDWRHPDLRQNTWQNLQEDADGDGHTIEWVGWQWDLDPGDLNGIDDDWNGYPDDLIGWDFHAWDVIGDGSNPDPITIFKMHGTHVAGIAAAKTDNFTGVSSVSWNVKYLPTQTDDANIETYYGFEGIVYAAQRGADVINCSWGGFTFNPVEAEVMAYANALGSIMICSAGNNNYNEIRFPSAYPGVFATAAVNSADQKASYSSYGINVDIAAPGGDWGEDIWSTLTGGTYGGTEWIGTSMAAPLAAGLAALIKSYHPDWTREQVMLQLIGSCDNIDELNPGYEYCFGGGRINAYRALTDMNVLAPQFLKVDLLDYNVDDFDGDGIFAPGDTAILNLRLWNHAAFVGSDNALISLQTGDPDVNFLGETVINCIIPPDNLFELNDMFQISLSSTCQPHWAKFLLTIEADLPLAFGDSISFDVLVAPDGIFVFDPAQDKFDYSGSYIRLFLEDLGQQVLYSNIYPESFQGFDAVFLSFGNFGERLKNGMVLTYEQSIPIQQYAEQGGHIYIEMSGFFMGTAYFNFPNAMQLNDLFGVQSYNMMLVENPIDTLTGIEGTPFEGMNFTESSQHLNWFIDNLTAASGAYCLLEENDYGNVAIMNSGDHGQKTCYFSYALAELEDVDAISSRYNMLFQVMQHFGYEPEPGYVITNFTCETRGGAAGDTIRFRDISLTDAGYTIDSWQWDFENDGIIDSWEQQPDWQCANPGIYNVRLIASNGTTSDTLLYPSYIYINDGIFVFDGVPGANDYSGNFIRDFLLENNYGVTCMSQQLPPTFMGYEAVILCLGNWGGMHLTFFDDIFVSMVLDYLQHGGNLFLESAQALGLDQAGNEELLAAFGLDSAAFGTTNYIDHLAGKEGSDMDGLVFTGTSQQAPAYIDKYFPGSGIAAFEESDYGIVGVQHEFTTRTGTAKTFCFSYTLSGLDHDEEPNTREEFLWRLLGFFGLITEVNDPEVGSSQFVVRCFPNPTHSSIEFQVSSIEFQSVSLKIYDVHGREVAVVVDGRWPGGQVVRWDASGLPAGVYYYRLTTKDQRPTTGKIVKY